MRLLGVKVMGEGEKQEVSTSSVFLHSVAGSRDGTPGICSRSRIRYRDSPCPYFNIMPQKDAMANLWSGHCHVIAGSLSYSLSTGLHLPRTTICSRS